MSIVTKATLWVIFFAVAAGTASGSDRYEAKKLPAAIVAIAERQLEPDIARRLSMFGPVAMRDKVQGSDVWLVAMQKTEREYCSFIQADEIGAARELASYVGCSIESVRFPKREGAHGPLAVYRARVKNPQSGAWVVEYLVFVANPLAPGFCRSDQDPRFPRQWLAPTACAELM